MSRTRRNRLPLAPLAAPQERRRQVRSPWVRLEEMSRQWADTFFVGSRPLPGSQFPVLEGADRRASTIHLSLVFELQALS